jgi:hypothetical protein
LEYRAASVSAKGVAVGKAIRLVILSLVMGVCPACSSYSPHLGPAQSISPNEAVGNSSGNLFSGIVDDLARSSANGWK